MVIHLSAFCLIRLVSLQERPQPQKSREIWNPPLAGRLRRRRRRTRERERKKTMCYFSAYAATLQGIRNLIILISLFFSLIEDGGIFTSGRLIALFLWVPSLARLIAQTMPITTSNVGRKWRCHGCCRYRAIDTRSGRRSINYKRGVRCGWLAGFRSLPWLHFNRRGGQKQKSKKTFRILCTQ